MNKKRIAIFGVKYFPSRGGTSRVVENLLQALHEEYDFTIYCYKHPAAEGYIPNVKTVQFKESPVKGLGVFSYYFNCCKHLLQRQDEYDLVHLHKMDAAFFLPLLCRKFKVIATCHALPYLNEKWSWFGKTYFRLAEYLLLRSSAFVTAIAQPQVDYFRRQYLREVHFIPNGIQPLHRILPEQADDILFPRQIADGYLLFAARRVIPLKGCHTLLKALRRMDFQGTLVIAGELDQLPSYTEELRELAKGLDVHFVGYVAGMDKLNALLSRAKLFVFPSEIEGMSMMLLEAGCVGTPMLCSDIPQNKAVLQEEEVLYFQSTNVKDLEDKLRWALTHPADMQKRADRTRKKIAKDYLMSKVVREYTALYDHLIEKIASALPQSSDSPLKLQ
ncbi:MAG: glycosyltransferase family 4 protein [Bacteroidota bacterium]